MDGKDAEEADALKVTLLNHKATPPLEQLKRSYSHPPKREPVSSNRGPKNEGSQSPTDSKTFGSNTTGYVPPWWRGDQANAKVALKMMKELPK